MFLKDKNRLHNKHPHLVQEWDLEKNYPLKPEDVSASSNSAYHWICEKGHHHKTRPARRAKNGCPECNVIDKRLRRSVEFWAAHPALKNQLHLARNSVDIISQITAGSHEKLWWTCPTCGGPWLCAVNERTRLDIRQITECKNCATKARAERHSRTRRKDGNTLGEKFPGLAKEWAEDLNGFSASQITPASNKAYWWRCELGHIWKSKVGNRTILHRGCPKCRDFSTSLLELRFFTELNHFQGEFAQLRAKIKGYEADIFIPSLRLILECDGYPWHNRKRKREVDLRKNEVWSNDNYIVIRVRDEELNPIEGNVITFKERGQLNHKEIVAGTLNLILKVVQESEYIERILKYQNSTEGFLADEAYANIVSQRVAKATTTLASLNPGFVEEWDFDTNGLVTPDRVSPSSGYKAHWICKVCGYRWVARVGNRTALKRGCPECAKSRVQLKRMKKFLSCGNTLAHHFPELVKEWDVKKNGDLDPYKVTPYSNRMANWTCSVCGFHWNAQICNRTRIGSGCPACYRRNPRRKKSDTSS